MARAAPASAWGSAGPAGPHQCSGTSREPERQPRPQALSRAGEPAQGSRAGAEAPGTESRKLTDVDVAARSRRRSGTARLCSRRVGLGRGVKLSPGVVNRRAGAPPLFGDQLGQAADAWPVLGEHGVGLSRREVRAPGASRPWAGGTGAASSEHPDPSGVPEAGLVDARPLHTPEAAARTGLARPPGTVAFWPAARHGRQNGRRSATSQLRKSGRDGAAAGQASAANEDGAPGGRRRTGALRGGRARQQSAPRPGGSWGRHGASPCRSG